MDQPGSTPLLLWVDLQKSQQLQISKSNLTVNRKLDDLHVVRVQFRYLALWRPVGVAVTLKCQSHGVERTLRASSTIPFIIFVHVKCNTVSTPYPVCVSSASSRLRSFVDPPAPHVILIAIGLRAERRSMRVIRFSNPYDGMVKFVRY